MIHMLLSRDQAKIEEVVLIDGIKNKGHIPFTKKEI